MLAARGGVDAIILSNHGGRQLDTSRSGIEVLEEVVHALRHAGLLVCWMVVEKCVPEYQGVCVCGCR